MSIHAKNENTVNDCVLCTAEPVNELPLDYVLPKSCAKLVFLKRSRVTDVVPERPIFPSRAYLEEMASRTMVPPLPSQTPLMSFAFSLPRNFILTICRLTQCGSPLPTSVLLVVPNHRRKSEPQRAMVEADGPKQLPHRTRRVKRMDLFLLRLLPKKKPR